MALSAFYSLLYHGSKSLKQLSKAFFSPAIKSPFSQVSCSCCWFLSCCFLSCCYKNSFNLRAEKGNGQKQNVKNKSALRLPKSTRPNLFTILEPPNLSIDVSELHKNIGPLNCEKIVRVREKVRTS